jgi:DNA-binding winged helix-turn-helix (wHTH) protein
VADGVDIQLQKHEVTVDGALVPISPTQFRILESLITAPGHYRSRPALLDYVWGKGFAIIPHALDVHISSLRRKLNSHGTSREFIQTVKGLGYKLRSTTLPSEAPPIQPFHSVPAGTGLPSPRPYLPPAYTVNMPRLGGSQWRHKPERRVAARYRVRPLYDCGDQG